MDRAQLVAFIRNHRFAVEASVAADGRPQAAVVGVACTDDLELVFDTLQSTRKYQNLRREPRVALVVGFDDGEAQTVQLEGVVDEPTGAEQARIKEAYFAAFPEGRERERWDGITWMRVRVTWARYSDFRSAEPRIVQIV